MQFLKILRLFSLAFTLGTIASATSASAMPIMADASDFDGTEIVLDFETIAEDEEITNQFSGITFSGGLFGNTVQNPFFFGSPVGAANFANQNAPFNPSIDVIFSSPIDRFRFDAVTNTQDDINIEIVSVLGVTTSILFNTGLTAASLAVLDADGIASIRIGIVGPADGADDAFILDNFEFGGSPATTVPEPSSAFLLGLGLYGLSTRRRGA